MADALGKLGGVACIFCEPLVGSVRERGRWRLSPLGSVGPWSADDEYEERASARGIHEPPIDKAWIPPQRMCIVDVTDFDKAAQAVADEFKRWQPVILSLQRADEDLSKRMVDFCAGLTYALNGEMHSIVDRLLLLTPNAVEVFGKEGPRDTRKAFFNRL